MVGKQLMVCVHVTSSAKGQSLLEKPTSIKICIHVSLTHTHAHGSMYVYICSCMPTTLSPSPGLSPLAHSNRMPQHMYASVPRCMPIARLGLIHHTMLSHPNALLRKPCQCVGACVYVCACACGCMFVS